MSDSNAPCTVLVNPRDKLSPTDRTLRHLLRFTDPSVPIHMTAGGVPADLRARWQEEFGHRVTFEFHEHFLRQAEARNHALANVGTDLAVVMDNDVYVREGWLDALLSCRRDTGAVMVVPLILEGERRIHCAGNKLYVNYEGDVPYGHKVLPLNGYTYGNGCNLERSPVDYGELHIQLVEVEPTLELGAYDERIIEVGEVDSGLTWAAAGYEMWFEPRSVVHFDLTHPVEWVDVDLFAWRWDMRTVGDGYAVFEEKWGLDITEQGRFREFLIDYNTKLPLLPRWFHREWSYRTSERLTHARAATREALRSAKRGVRARTYHADGYWRKEADFAQDATPDRAPFVRAWSPPQRVG
jgi:hypothetical protein